MISVMSWADLAISVSLYIRELVVLLFLRYWPKTFHTSFSRQKVAYLLEQHIFTKFGMNYCPRQRKVIWRNFADRVTILYSCHSNWTFKIKFLYGSFFICEGYSSFVNIFSYLYSSMNKERILRSRKKYYKNVRIVSL